MVLLPLKGQHDTDTKRQLKRQGLAPDTLLGITSGGRVRHVCIAVGTELKDTLCGLFRHGTSLLRQAESGVDVQPLCGACCKTLGAEVLRAKYAMSQTEGKGEAS